MNEQIGWSNESKLLREIIKLLDRVNKTTAGISGGTLTVDLTSIITEINENEALLTTIDADTGAIVVDVAAIKALIENAPVQASGTVALATSRYIPTSAGVQMNREKISIQLLSTNLSANTTFSPEASADGTNWDVLTENDTDISHTLADDVPFFRIYELDKDAYIRWVAAGSTTGDVAYVINN